MSKQCDLRRNNLTTTAWIPNRYARQGSYIRIGKENGWFVEKVYGLSLDQEYLAEYSNDYRTQRRASDV
jgi:hypothetical protein